MQHAAWGTLAAGAAWPLLGTERLFAAPPPISVDNRRYESGHQGLELNNQFAGWVSSAAQGHASDTVVVRSTTATPIPYMKVPLQRAAFLGGNAGEIELHCGTGMSREFYQWLQSNLAQAGPPQNGAITGYNFNYQPVARVEWQGGLIRQVVFPALDAASKAPGSMQVNIAAKSIRHTDQGLAAVPLYKNDQIVNRWGLNAFRCVVKDCEENSLRISQVDSITLAGRGPGSYVRSTIYAGAASASSQTPNLIITLAESHSQQFHGWQATPGELKSATLDYLSADMRTPLFSLAFRQLAIKSFTPQRAEAHSEQVRRVTVGMYSPDIQFVPASA